MKKLIITVCLACITMSSFSAISKVNDSFSYRMQPNEPLLALYKGNYLPAEDNPVKKNIKLSKDRKLKVDNELSRKDFCYILMEDGCYVLGEIVVESDGMVYWVPLLNDPNYAANYPGFNLRFCPYSMEEMQYAC